VWIDDDEEEESILEKLVERNTVAQVFLESPGDVLVDREAGLSGHDRASDVL